MAKSPAFQFYPRDWLGDPEIMLMDWDAKAMHLHCICIAWLHTDACALPDDDALLCKWLNIKNDADWQERLKPQIFSAWELTDGQWVQNRLKREKIKQLERSKKMKKAANSRWEGECKSNAKAYANAMQKQCSSSSSSTAVNNISANADSCSADAKHPPLNGCPYQKIVDLYHEKLPMLPKIKILNDARRKSIRARWVNELPDLETWEQYFTDCSRSKFLTGKVDPSPGRRQFLADIDFLIRPSTVAKTSEGKYHRK